ncbi:prsA ribose-phosphate pyrophosphokinase [Thermotomaculum hydrothermale]|uniref:Ribose-phosphate pyrophosphokinase n=1 Tax=Thermotomaculum hydrothermale TaxID=981385 RepID=A0A7R6PYZ8_9BACT|nr:ribose-phosphate pyrophosphokinase [Thermotomaculum hydrothermale]BBB32248.1 prsA ribose-phosphate pyrophosphokinase [Thermotomaculum hydrothermale]
MRHAPLKVFAGNSNPSLAEKIAEYLKEEVGVGLGDIELTRFSDGEISCHIRENVRGTDVFVIQSTCNPANDNLMELLIMLDTLKRASAVRITAVIPYFGYARQDRKHKPRVPISAKLVADLLEKAGANRVISMDLHANQIQGFFDIPVDHLYASAVFIPYLRNMEFKNLCIVSPDAGGAERARAYSKRLDASLVLVDKRREKANEAEVMNVVGEVDGRDLIIVDDIIDTAGTLVKTAKALKERGALRIFAVASHGVLSGVAMERIEESCIEKIFITDSIPFDKKLDKKNKVEILSVAKLIGEAIKRAHEETSISSLFID